jgi:K+-sensing histidine kinase KdpD
LQGRRFSGRSVKFERDMAEPSPENRSDSLSIPWIDTVRFIRQLTHDLRNHLNAIELQSAYISELEDDAKLKGEVIRLREMISRLTSALQKLSGKLSEVRPNLISYRASDFVEDMRKKIAQEFPNEGPQVSWDVQPGNAVLNIDPQLLQEAIVELFANAFRHDRGKGTLAAEARIDKTRFLFTLLEPKIRFESSTENWGREPFRKVGHGHYGLGLNRVRTIVEAHGGEMHAQYDPKASAFVTTLTLPL